MTLIIKDNAGLFMMTSGINGHTEDNLMEQFRSKKPLRHTRGKPVALFVSADLARQFIDSYQILGVL